MSYSKESLEKLLVLIKEILKNPDNNWFKNDLANFLEGGANQDFSGYVKLLRKNFKLKANDFYKNIDESKLKNQLVKDHIEMLWFQTIGDMGRFLVYLYYQFENLLKYYFIKNDGYNKILESKNEYIYVKDNFKVICVDNFFFYERESSTYNRKDLDKCSIWGFIVFWMINAKVMDWGKKNHVNLSNLVNIRNKYSHRNSIGDSNEYLEKTILDLKNKDISFLSFYLNILKEIVKSINPISQFLDFQPLDLGKNEDNESSNPHTLRGLKVLGKIDLPKKK